jgi:hypothetical protein
MGRLILLVGTCSAQLIKKGEIYRSGWGLATARSAHYVKQRGQAHLPDL